MVNSVCAVGIAHNAKCAAHAPGLLLHFNTVHNVIHSIAAAASASRQL